MSYPAYGQHPQHYGQPTTPMMANPQQYPGQQAYPQQQMWNPNVSILLFVEFLQS